MKQESSARSSARCYIQAKLLVHCAVSPSGQEAFPPLPQAAPAARQPPPSGLQARPFINPLAAKAPAKGKVSKAPAAKVGPQVQCSSASMNKGFVLAISTKIGQIHKGAMI